VESGVATRVSLEQFLSNPDIHYYDFHELHNGEVVVVSPPTVEHVDLQKCLEDLFGAVLGADYVAHREFYITLPTESRRVDVAAVKRDRWTEMKNKVFFGAPELVVEVLSPSNTHLDVDHLRVTCLREGTRQFWVVNMELETVTVYKPDFEVAIYNRRRPDISLSELNPGAVVAVTAIFD
jgi:Uma2 family endonuclease